MAAAICPFPGVELARRRDVAGEACSPVADLTASELADLVAFLEIQWLPPELRAICDKLSRQHAE